MPLSPPGDTAPSCVLHVLDRALDQSHDAPAGVLPLPPAVAAPLGAVIKVLVAEDDDFMRDLVHRVLDSAGMQVVTYASGVELLGATDLASATALLLDVNMPGMSGLDLQERLKHRGVDLPVTGMSGKLIARELGGSFRTIEVHRAQVMHKMEVRHLSELVRMSIESMPAKRAAAR